MGRDKLWFGVKIRRSLVISVRTCYGSACNHPFLLGFACFLLFLYRASPFLFSLLVSASPILVCTAVLLGTILSFGQPNIPEIEKEQSVNHESAPLKTEVAKGTTVVERDENHMVERNSRRRKDGIEGGNEESRHTGSQVSDDTGSVHYRSLIDESSHENHHEEQAAKEIGRGFDLEAQKGIERTSMSREAWQGADFGETAWQESKSRSAGYESLDEMIDTKDDHLDLSPVSPWKPMRHDYDDDDNDGRGESLDSGSDGAESSSPDASMADIIPILDELHPLLDSKGPQPAHVSRQDSDAASVGTDQSSDEGLDSDADTQDHGEGRENEEDDDNADDEYDDDDAKDEDKKGDNEDESKSAIKWTEIDQKNLMDLGTSELERNQRLESLIARRRARKNMSFMAERNLIDLDSADIPFNVPPISTARRNPFELPYDSYNDLGLPPIPGSAPSILLPRRNPFDLPYEPNEEKPDLKGDSFHEEFSASHEKEMVFRRHESFNVGPSIFGGPRRDRQEKFRPIFVPERLAGEGTTYFTYERQLSEISESKVSSVPDTESVSTGMDEEDKKATGHDENDMMSNLDHASLVGEKGSQSTEHAESVDFENAETRDAHHDVAEVTLGVAEGHIDRELSLSDNAETRIEKEPRTSQIHDDRDQLEEDDSVGSSVSSLSEVHEGFSEAKKEESMSFVKKGDIVEEPCIFCKASIEKEDSHFVGASEDERQGKRSVQETGISARSSLDESDGHFMSAVEGVHQHKEPVYDSSPQSIKKFLSFSSASSDSQAEISETVYHSTAEAGDKSSESHSNTKEHSESGFVEASKASADLSSSPSDEDEKKVRPAFVAHASDEDESRTDKAIKVSKHNTSALEPFRVDDPQNSVVPENSLEYVSVDPSSSPSDKDESYCLLQDQVHSFVTDRDSAPSSTGNQPSFTSVEHFSMFQPHSSSSDMENLSTDIAQGLSDTPENRGTMHPERDQGPSPSFDANIRVDDFSTLPAIERQISEAERTQPQSDSKIDTHLAHPVAVKASVDISSQNVASEEQSPSTSPWSDKSMGGEREHREPSVESVGVNFATEVTLHEFHDSEDRTSIHLSCLTHDSTTTQSDSPEYKTPMVGDDWGPEFFYDDVYEDLDSSSERLDHADEVHESHLSRRSIDEDTIEIKEIDEGLLSELDRVGDFSVKEIIDESMRENRSTEDTSLPMECTSTTEAKIELPMLEARSIEGIDLAFKQIDEGAEIDEVILPSMIEEQLIAERSMDHKDTKPAFETVEAESLEDICIALKKAQEDSNDRSIKQETTFTSMTELEKRAKLRPLDDASSASNDDLKEQEAKSSPKQEVTAVETSTAEGKMGLPMLEARSVEDIDSAFKQIHEGIHEGAEVHKVILPSMIEEQLAAQRSMVERDTNSELQTVEAKSVQDIDNALKSAQEDNKDGSLKQETDVSYKIELEEQTESRALEDASPASSDDPKEQEAKDLAKQEIPVVEANTTQGKTELPVLEARSVEDMDSAFKQIHEGTEIDEVILPSVIEEQPTAERCMGKKNTKSVLQTVEAKSVNNIDIAFKKAQEDNNDRSIKQETTFASKSELEERAELRPLDDASSASSDDLREQEAKSSLKQEVLAVETSTAEGKMALPMLEARSIDDVNSAFKQIQEGAEINEVVLPSVIKERLVAQRALDHTEIEFEAVEVKSVKDIDIALKKAQEDSDGSAKQETNFALKIESDEMAKLRSLDDANSASSDKLKEQGAKDSPKQDVRPVETSNTEGKIELLMLEARSVEDIDSTFKQIHEQAEIGEVVLPSMVEGQLAAERSTGERHTISGSEIVEAKSVNDIDIAIKSAQEDNTDSISLDDVHNSPDDHSSRGLDNDTMEIKSGPATFEVKTTDVFPKASGTKNASPEGRPEFNHIQEKR